MSGRKWVFLYPMLCKTLRTYSFQTISNLEINKAIYMQLIIFSTKQDNELFGSFREY